MKRPSMLLSAVAALAAVGTLTLSAVQLASAQEPRTRHGFWGAFGLGYGSNSLSCSGGCTFNSGSSGGAPPRRSNSVARRNRASAWAVR